MKPILHTLPSGGSPAGLSRLLTLLECARKFNLDANPRPGPNGEDTTPIHFAIGTIYHAFQELYRNQWLNGGKSFEASKVKLRGGCALNEEARVIAERCFKAYRVAFPANHFGRIIAVEQPVPDMKRHSVRRLLEFHKAVGSYPLDYTLRADLVVKITKADAKRLLRDRNVKVKPGYWLIDYKTAAWINKELWRYYENSIQMLLYQLAWNVWHPKQQLEGALVDVVTKQNKPDFALIPVRKPQRNDRMMIANMFKEANAILSDPTRRDRAHGQHCITWREECQHSKSGRCTKL